MKKAYKTYPDHFPLFAGNPPIFIFILVAVIQIIGYTYHIKTSKLQRNFDFININAPSDNQQKIVYGGTHNKSAVPAIPNRFIARGIITDVKQASKGIQRFTIQIKKVEQFKDYHNLGENYLDKEVEILSEIGIPSSFQTGAEVSLVLRVSGGEKKQSLFLVEVIENGTSK